MLDANIYFFVSIFQFKHSLCFPFYRIHSHIHKFVQFVTITIRTIRISKICGHTESDNISFFFILIVNARNFNLTLKLNSLCII